MIYLPVLEGLGSAWLGVAEMLTRVLPLVGAGLAQAVVLSRGLKRPVLARWTFLSFIGGFGALAAIGAYESLEAARLEASGGTAGDAPWPLAMGVPYGLGGLVLGWTSAGPLERLAAGHSSWLRPAPLRRPLGATLLCLYTAMAVIRVDYRAFKPVWASFEARDPRLYVFMCGGFALLASAIGAHRAWKHALLGGGLLGLWAIVLATPGDYLVPSLFTQIPFALSTVGVTVYSIGLHRPNPAGSPSQHSAKP